MKVGVVADDITGANDIGSMFANGGYLAHVYPHDRYDPLPRDDQAHPDVVILDTNSRLDAPDIAYRKVFDATKRLLAAGCVRFFNKTCSVFRGNIGAEFDAMLDALDQEFAVVVLGFPKNGRVTIDGVHYVHGQRLDESPFRYDPVHPMTESNLVTILQQQTNRKVALLDHGVIAQGMAAIRNRIARMQAACNYLICDVPDQAAIATIARAVAACPVLCGSSALGEALPSVLGSSEAKQQTALPPNDHLGVLCAAGSLTPQTIAQIAYMQAHDVAAIELATIRIFESSERQAEIARIVAVASGYLADGRHVIVHTPNRNGPVAETQAEGARHGLSTVAVARLVSETLAEAVGLTVERIGLRRLVIAGGETSAAVCRRLGVQGLRVWQEIQPGLPSCISLSDPPRLLVLKSGSFGSADFLQQAIDHVQAQDGRCHDGGLRC